MGKVQVSKGQLIHSQMSTVKTVEIVLGGSVKMISPHGSITLIAGGMIGCLETPGTTYSYTYEAAEDATLFEYSYTKSSDLEKIIASNPKIIANLAAAAERMYIEAYQNYQRVVNDADSLFRFISDSYNTYIDLCMRFKATVQVLTYMEDMTKFSPDDDIPVWTPQYVNALRTLSPEVKKSLYSSSVYIGLGQIMQMVEGTNRIQTLINHADDYLSELSGNVISGNAGDFFDLYSNLLFHVSTNPFADTTPIEASVSKLIIYMTDSKYVDIGILHERVSQYRKNLKDIEEAILSEDSADIEKDAYEALDHSMEIIFDYAGLEIEAREEFRDLIDEYKLLPDKNSSDDDARKLRRKITDVFYHTYEMAFLNSITDRSIPAAVKMFFNFGYLDEELCGMNNAAALFDIVKSMKPDPKGRVITAYEWLMKVYKGEVEPSKNEFDMDYPAYLRDQRTNGYITKEKEQEMLTSVTDKLHFEIFNLLSLGNRITYGRVTTFCPVLSEHNILRPVKSMFLTPERVHEALDEIRAIDYSCFYREVLYTNPKLGMNQEYFNVEILPHIILMPNVGSRGAMWQETAGTKKDTPGRMMVSVCALEDISDVLIKLCGEFKWELCKHIQGVHWNDVTDPSLTADYCDYLQFYRKNRDLSSDAKEKLKLQLQRAKNNYKQAFVIDYVQWIKYESKGSPRLNKVARTILYKYATFPDEIRKQISSNPMYAELAEKRKLKLAQKKHIYDVLITKIRSTGYEPPQELLDEIAFLER